jgi:hypothetical protein
MMPRREGERPLDGLIESLKRLRAQQSAEERERSLQGEEGTGPACSDMRFMELSAIMGYLESAFQQDKYRESL